MQMNFSEIANEAISVNTKLFSKSVESGVESAQQFVQGASDQSGEWLKVKTFDDYVSKQENWNSFAIDQVQKATRSVFDLGNEAYSSYLTLWQKFSQVANQQVVAEVAKKKA